MYGLGEFGKSKLVSIFGGRKCFIAFFGLVLLALLGLIFFFILALVHNYDGVVVSGVVKTILYVIVIGIISFVTGNVLEHQIEKK